MNSIKYLFSTILLVASCILTISLDLPVYAFICLYIILMVLSAVIGYSLPIFKYYDRCKTVELMEMVYNNYKNYKQKTFLTMIYMIALFALFALCLFIVILDDSSTSETIFFIIMTIGSGLGALYRIISYMRVARSKQIILDETLQKIYPLYKAERDTRSYEEIYEEILLPRPKYYQAVNIVNKIAAITILIMGLFILAFLYSYRNDIFTNTIDTIITVGFACTFSIASIYYGTKDILKTSTTQEQKITFLLLSCLLAALLYTPTSHQLNKLFLKGYVHNIKSYNYNSKTNVFQDTIKVQNIADQTYIYRKQSLPLSYLTFQKALLKKLIRAGAEYQIVYIDTINNKQIVAFSLNELKDICNQKRSDLEIRIELLKLIVDEPTVYDDGKYIVIEMNRGKNVPPPYTTPSEQNDFLTWLTNYTKEFAFFYKIAYFNRGLRIRYIFNNNQFVESAVSLNELRNKEKQKKTNTSQKSKSFFKRFSKQPDN